MIYRMHSDGGSLRSIGRSLGRDSSTISRELRRNVLPKSGYLPTSAGRMAQARRWRGSRLARSDSLRQTIVDRLAMGWSPEIIAGRLEREHGSKVVSHESIYRFIYSTQGRKDRLYRYLRQGKARRGYAIAHNLRAGFHRPMRFYAHIRKAKKFSWESAAASLGRTCKTLSLIAAAHSIRTPRPFIWPRIRSVV